MHAKIWVSLEQYYRLQYTEWLIILIIIIIIMFVVK